MTKIGNKQNSFLNKEWAKHVRRWFKKYTSSKRRQQDKEIIKEQSGGRKTFHQKCPDCNSKMSSVFNIEIDKLIYKCNNCKKEWI